MVVSQRDGAGTYSGFISHSPFLAQKGHFAFESVSESVSGVVRCGSCRWEYGWWGGMVGEVNRSVAMFDAVAAAVGSMVGE